MDKYIFVKDLGNNNCRIFSRGEYYWSTILPTKYDKDKYIHFKISDDVYDIVDLHNLEVLGLCRSIEILTKLEEV